MVECLVDEDDVVRRFWQAQLVEVGDLVAEAICVPRSQSSLPSDPDRLGREVNACDRGAQPDLQRRAFEVSDPAAQREPDPPRPELAGEPFERPFVRIARDAPVDGGPAERVRHPEPRVLRACVMVVPKPGCDAEGRTGFAGAGLLTSANRCAGLLPRHGP